MGVIVPGMIMAVVIGMLMTVVMAVMGMTFGCGL
jgi:hypothetical protein